MKSIIHLVFLTIFAFNLQAQDNALPRSERHVTGTKILEGSRFYEVHLPKDYTYFDDNTYPVLYVVDGDYNFHFVTGMVEMLIESGKIPAMIVVGIADQGTRRYRNYCRPTIEGAVSGDADTFMDYIEKELKPHVNKSYRTSSYEIIMGHSMGGLFTTNYWLTRPNDFDDYIAIDPSLWWNQNEIVPRADSLFKERKTLDSNIYLSLASTKGMGVLGFVGVLDKYYLDQKNWHFNHYKNDNHGSVALPSIQFALEDIFKDWVMTEEKYAGFENIEALFESYVDLEKAFDTQFALPTTLLGNSIYYEYQKPGAIDKMEAIIAREFPESIAEFTIQKAMLMKEFGEVEKGVALLKKHIMANPKDYKAHDAICQLYMAQKEWSLAFASGQEALTLAKRMKLRMWQVNQIEGHLIEVMEHK